jgi:hypothetical protein
MGVNGPCDTVHCDNDAHDPLIIEGVTVNHDMESILIIDITSLGLKPQDDKESNQTMSGNAWQSERCIHRYMDQFHVKRKRLVNALHKPNSVHIDCTHK